MSRASRPLRKDAARNRELLIESARVVFARRGLEASLDDIAHQAGLGVGTAYRHFANKYELATALMQQTIDLMVDSAEQALTADDPWDGLVSFLEAALTAQTVDRGLREVLMGVHDPEKMEQVHDRLIGPISELLLRAQRAGRIRADADTTDLGFIIGMLCTVADMAAAIAGAVAALPDHLLGRAAAGRHAVHDPAADRARVPPGDGHPQAADDPSHLTGIRLQLIRRRRSAIGRRRRDRVLEPGRQIGGLVRCADVGAGGHDLRRSDPGRRRTGPRLCPRAGRRGAPSCAVR